MIVFVFIGNSTLDSQHRFDEMNGAKNKNVTGYRRCFGLHLQSTNNWIYAAQNCTKHLTYSQSYLCEYSKYRAESYLQKLKLVCSFFRSVVDLFL